MYKFSRSKVCRLDIDAEWSLCVPIIIIIIVYKIHEQSYFIEIHILYVYIVNSYERER